MQGVETASYFPYNTLMSPRRLDYLASRNLAFITVQVGSFRDRARSDHEPILGDILLPARAAPKNTVVWSARQLKKKELP